jgi:hypothetical protein
MQMPFHCMMCDKNCLKPFNGLCEECQKKEVTSRINEEEE